MDVSMLGSTSSKYVQVARPLSSSVPASMARPKKPQAYTGVVTLGVVLLTVLLSPDWTSLQVIKAVHALFMASFFTFNYLCYRLKSAVVEANDQRVIKVPTDDGKGTQSQSVSAYDTDACNMLMVKGTLVRPSVLPAPHNHLCMCPLTNTTPVPHSTTAWRCSRGTIARRTS